MIDFEGQDALDFIRDNAPQDYEFVLNEIKEGRLSIETLRIQWHPGETLGQLKPEEIPSGKLEPLPSFKKDIH